MILIDLQNETIIFFHTRALEKTNTLPRFWACILRRNCSEEDRKAMLDKTMGSSSPASRQVPLGDYKAGVKVGS